MEDYHGAFEQRSRDTEILIASDRKTAAMHWGGITVEALLKAIIVSYHNITEWKSDSHDPGHSITNPKHDLLGAVKRVNKLKTRLESVPGMLEMLHRVQDPDGFFVDLRYASSEPENDRYNRWLESYRRLVHWLQVQATRL